MKEQLLRQIEQHIHTFFQAAKLNRKKWYKDIKNIDELLYSFFVVRRRMIQPKHYTIQESNKMNLLTLKPEAARDYLSLKAALFEKGDLKKFHTENSKILYPIDGLLEEWNINHLHIDRSRYQVFFVAEENNIFIIQICKHFERNRTGYSKKSLLETLQENWPEKFHKKEFIKSANFSEKYNSAYGWQKVDQFYAWLHEVIFVIEKHNILSEIIFMDNEKFVTHDTASETIIPTTVSFNV